MTSHNETTIQQPQRTHNEITIQQTTHLGCQHFKMPNVMQATYFGSHLVVIRHLFGILKC